MAKGRNNWTRKDIKENGIAVARIHRRVITKKDYESFKESFGLSRGNEQFAFKQIADNKGRLTTAVATGVLTRRRANAKRESLAYMDVLNKGYKPNDAHKAHLIPDVFGAPSVKENLSNAPRVFNLSGHKRIENSIGAMMKESHPDAGPRKRRGSITVMEHFDEQGRGMKREYVARIEAGDNQPERYAYFRMDTL